MNSGLNCHAIPAGQPFLAALAGWILEQYGKDATLLTRALVLLPNRRACRSLREAFLEATSGHPLLLPRIRPIGDLDEEMLFWPEVLTDDLPPAIDPMRRELLLTRLVMAFRSDPSDEAKRAPHIEQAARLARQLTRFIDEVVREGLDFNGLARLAPEDLAAHWQETLDFLSIVSRHWPEMLAGENAIDPAEHRNRVLTALARLWQRNPPDYPVIAAGSTGSIPATAKLLKAIARLPQGHVVLPGLDLDMPQAEWEALGETHPQYGLKQLLRIMECERDKISLLRDHKFVRADLLRAALQSPEATAHWPQISLSENALVGMSLIVADTQADEARMIAVAMRQTLETPGKTAALVTPDRTLARMVVAQMQRFGIAIDDSAGRELKETVAGSFLRLVAAMVASAAAPAPLLSVLRHPLAAAGMAPVACRELSRKLELELLRGIRHAPGLEALAQSTDQPDIRSLLETLAKHSHTLMGYFSNHKPVSFAVLLKEHLALAEWLAGTPDTLDSERLWTGEAGNALADYLARLLPHSELLGDIDPMLYPGLFDALIAGHTYRPSYGLHPRLHILSPIEARLQQFDLAILGGLNEGSWPALPEPDPWMSRPMREAFGLPPLERGIGQSAHDFWLLASSKEVLLTRARKVEGAPAVPSRWLVRLETLLKGLAPHSLKELHKEHYYEEARALLDAPLPMEPLTPPAPCPPLDARPRKMSVTAIDNWLADPYMIYAQRILGLYALDPLDQEPDNAEFGSMVHGALARFCAAWPKSLPENAIEKLLECGKAEFSALIDRPAVACLWWPRFESMAGWLIEQEKERRGQLQSVIGEVTGEWRFKVDEKEFTLTTRIDRLEIAHDSNAVIADYKTGSPPAMNRVENGEANQLPLEALVAVHGKLQPEAHPRAISALEYWKLSGDPAECDISRYKGDVAALAETAKARLEALVRKFDDTSTPYAAAEESPSPYNHYEHLTRRSEWGES